MASSVEGPDLNQDGGSETSGSFRTNNAWSEGVSQGAQGAHRGPGGPRELQGGRGGSQGAPRELPGAPSHIRPLRPLRTLERTLLGPLAPGPRNLNSARHSLTRSITGI